MHADPLGCPPLMSYVPFPACNPLGPDSPSFVSAATNTHGKAKAQLLPRTMQDSSPP